MDHFTWRLIKTNQFRTFIISVVIINIHNLLRFSESENRLVLNDVTSSIPVWPFESFSSDELAAVVLRLSHPRIPTVRGKAEDLV